MSSSLFKKPDPPRGITFMIRGEPGTGKTRFALGVRRVTKLPCAYLGTDRGSKFYANDPEIGGFLQVETRDVEIVEKALDELEEDWGKSYGAAVVDTITDLWSLEQAVYEKTGKDKNTGIPMRAWRPLRGGHETKLRRLQALPMHVFLICEEKPIYEKRVVKDGDQDRVDLVEVGSKEDSDKKDAYISDVRLRMFVDQSGGGEALFCCEVLKDRTGTFAMGTVLENPSVEMWVKGAAVAGPRPTKPQAASQDEIDQAAADAANKEALAADTKIADAMIERIANIANVYEGGNWKKKHRVAVNALAPINKKRVAAAYEARITELEAQAVAAAGTSGAANGGAS